MDGVSSVVAILHLREIASGAAAAITWVVSVVTGPETAAAFADAIQLDRLAWSTTITLLLIGFLFSVVFALETLTRANRASYLGRTFRQDVIYALFYQGGFYTVLIWAALATAMQEHLGFLRIELLATLPGPVHWLLYWVIVDFITYWWHRGLHSWGPLWAIHSVHHVPQDMSFLSSYRLHPLEQLMQNVVMVAPLLVLGVPTFQWLPLVVGMALLEGFQHSALQFDYGKGYYLLVSPRFHALHHSSDPAHHHSNFSKIFSVWDFLFGTAVKTDAPPERLGVDGMRIPVTMGQQLVAPLHVLRGTASAPPAGAGEDS